LDGEICLEKAILFTGYRCNRYFTAAVILCGHFIEQYIMYMVHIFIHVLIVYEVFTICFLLLFVYYRLVNIANTQKSITWQLSGIYINQLRV
jgi:hypothetical protein